MNSTQPFIEKYRPTVLSDVVGNGETIDRLKIIARDGNIPNLIISGPPGTGKTTSIACLAHELLGDAYKEAVLELNASDDRGIEVVRSKIKSFAQKKVTLPPGRHKIVILDEADNMTVGAQQSMRRTMENFSKTTRFALACNQSVKIIEPIQSRCAILRFTMLSDEEIVRRLLQVIEAEKITYSRDGLEALVFTAEGDMRHALNNLQATHSGFGHVSAENVFKVCDQPHPVLITALVTACAQADIDKALVSMQKLLRDGYSSIDVINTLFRIVKTFKEISEELKLEFVREIGITHMRCVKGLDSELQLHGLVARLCQCAIAKQK